MIAEADLSACREAIRHGSLSFHAASRLLPRRVRNPALALYAFCRLADDAVDLQDNKAAAVLRLRDRLDRAYAGRPMNAAADRAFAAMIEAHDMPRALPEALLEGFAWDAMDRRYETLSDLHAYSARVAAAVGAMMTVLMGIRDADALARACDLGLAMQLTNIARDVGEDAREGRLYLPESWLSEVGVDPAYFLRDPQPSPAIARLTRRLLAEANRLYFRAEAGIAALPVDCRAGIYAARFIYGGIGGRIARDKHDSVSRRARTSRAQKLGWLLVSAERATASCVMPRSAVLYAPPMPEVAFLVDAAARAPAPIWNREAPLIDALATLANRDRTARASLIGGGVRPT